MIIFQRSASFGRSGGCAAARDPICHSRRCAVAAIQRLLALRFFGGSGPPQHPYMSCCLGAVPFLVLIFFRFTSVVFRFSIIISSCLVFGYQKQCKEKPNETKRRTAGIRLETKQKHELYSTTALTPTQTSNANTTARTKTHAEQHEHDIT